MNMVLRFSLWFLICAAFTTIGDAQSKLEAAFQKLDTDSDGKVTAKEAPDREKVIKAGDKDQDGGLSLAELKEYFKELRETPKAPPVTKTAEEFPEGAPVSPETCRMAAAYSDEANGHAVVVMYQGQILFEHYANGWSEEQGHRLASGTKSFSGAMLAVAAKDGLLQIDEKVADTIEEWKEDEKLSAITLRHLLSLTSGIPPGDNGNVPSYLEAIAIDNVLSPPGEEFRYGPVAYQVFGEVMKRKLGGTDPLEYLEEKIFTLIGMKYEEWRRDSDGNPQLPSGAFIRATEWIKFGEFLRTDEGKTLDPEVFAACIKGSEANPVYGLTFWLSDHGFRAAGAGKQRLYILPEKELVAVRFGETQGRRFEDGAFLDKLLKE